MKADDDDKTVITVDDEEEDNEGTKNKKKGNGVVFLLWGKPASLKAQTVISKYQRGDGQSSKQHQKHAVIMCSHPSPLGATKTSSPFMGSKCFSRANDELRKRGYDGIDWRVDGPLKEGGVEDDDEEEGRGLKTEEDDGGNDDDEEI